MKKLLVLLLLASVALQAASDPCKPCAFAAQFPDRFHFISAYLHGAPVESVSTLCDCNTNPRLVAIAGYTSSVDCTFAQSIRAYSINEALGNTLEPIAVDIPNPSDFLYATDMCCTNTPVTTIPSRPLLAVAGCPDADGNVLWLYEYTTILSVTSFRHTVSWGAGVTAKPNLIYSVAIKCVDCDPTHQNPYYQIALVGKASADKTVSVYILRYDMSLSLPFRSITLQAKITLSNAVKDYYSVAWLPASAQTDPINPCMCNFSCPILTVAGTNSTGEDCVEGNIHNFMVTCDGVVSEVLSSGTGIGTIHFPGTEDWNMWSVRKVVWSNCCSLYPYPFLLAVGDRTNADGSVQSIVVVYYYNPVTGEFKELAKSEMWDGKLFAAQFTPGCACKAVTVAGGRCMDGYNTPCDANIWTLKFDCPVDGRYPVTMTRFADATHTSFDTTITSLAFCAESPCQVMIVTSEDPSWPGTNLDPLSCPRVTKGEIGVYKVAPCVTLFRPCVPEPICVRKSVREVPCRKR